MDINTNVSQKTAVSVTAFKAGSNGAAIDSTNHSGAEAVKIKTDDRSAGSSISNDGKAKGVNDDANLKKAVDDLNDFVQNTRRDLQFSIDKESGAMVVKVIDSKSEKVIRQIPSEETLKIARSLAEDKQDATFNIFSSRA